MDLEKEIAGLKEQIAAITSQRVTQASILPNAIRQRHVSGYIIMTGKDANKPANGQGGVFSYYAYDTKKLYIFNQSTNAFNYVTLT